MNPEPPDGNCLFHSVGSGLSEWRESGGASALGAAATAALDTPWEAAGVSGFGGGAVPVGFAWVRAMLVAGSVKLVDDSVLLPDARSDARRGAILKLIEGGDGRRWLQPPAGSSGQRAAAAIHPAAGGSGVITVGEEAQEGPSENIDIEPQFEMYLAAMATNAVRMWVIFFTDQCLVCERVNDDLC